MKLIKFDLPIDGVKVKTVEELREHFTPEILDHFRSGLLAKWLVSRKLLDELEAIKALDGAEDALLINKLCEIFGIEADEAVIATILNDPTPTFGLNIADAVKQSKDGDKIINLADLLPIQPGELKLFTNRFLVFDSLNLEGVELILKSENGTLIFKACESVINGRYKDLGNGVVLDIHTNLEWMRFLLGQAWTDNACTGKAKKYNWNQAKSAADELNRQGGYAGYCDWRLPSIDELKTLICNYLKPTIDPMAFPNAPISYVWSSSFPMNYEFAKFIVGTLSDHLYANKSYGPLAVDFSNGDVEIYDKGRTGFVRLVRS